MNIVGNGFLAKNLRSIAAKHEDTVVLAAGVSSAGGTSTAEFAREASLLDEVARDCVLTGRRLVFFSTAATGMYGLTTGPGREDEPVTPCTPYGLHKLALEERLRAGGTEYLVLRLGHLVGPDQPPHQLVPALVNQLRAGSVRVYRHATRDLIDVDDVVRIIDHLLTKGLRRDTINVASGEAVPVERIIDHLERRLGLTARREYTDAGGHHVISTAKLRTLTEIGFGPGYYRRVLDAFCANYLASGTIS